MENNLISSPRTIGHDDRCVNGHRAVSLRLERVKPMPLTAWIVIEKVYELFNHGELHVDWLFQNTGTLLVESQFSSSPVLGCGYGVPSTFTSNFYKGPPWRVVKVPVCSNCQILMMRPLLP